jgi:hypothetical protein
MSQLAVQDQRLGGAKRRAHRLVALPELDEGLGEQRFRKAGAGEARAQVAKIPAVEGELLYPIVVENALEPLGYPLVVDRCAGSELKKAPARP